MQWVALDREQRITADSAKKGTNYLCPECFSPVRARSGPHRRPHFYHIAKNSLCRQNGKTLFHLETQFAIQKELPEGESLLEVPFPTISRIADVAWTPQKLVFEVQYSPISHAEAKKRTEDYEGLGFQVVWILHDKRFNRRRLSSAEAFLASRDCYFSSIGEKGKGEIYDQFSLILGTKRRFRGAKLPISLASSYSMDKIRPEKYWPREAIARTTLKKIGFHGDLVDRISKSREAEMGAMKRIERRFQTHSSLFQKLQKKAIFLKKIYSSFLHALLEKHSI